jgi:hypothetical protein
VRPLRFLLALLMIGVVAYGLYTASTWLRYGKRTEGRSSANGRAGGPEGAGGDITRAALNRFLPTYEVSESHETPVKAPAAITFKAARELDLQKSPLATILFKSRRLLMGGKGPDTTEHRTTLEELRSLGWAVLEEVPGRSMVFGAVTRPWESNVRFRGLPPNEFERFQEPGYVKIIWTLEADPVDSTRSIFRTRTRVATTDAEASDRFRIYWTQFSPGIVLIRKQALGLVKAEAEKRARGLGKAPA